MQYQKELQEVRRRLKQYADKERAAVLQRYMNTGYRCLGLTVPQLRACVREPYSFYQLPPAQILKVWDKVFMRADVFEVMSQPLIYYGNKKDELTLSHLKIFSRWVGCIDNWEHSDRLSDLLSTLHERHPKEVFALLKKWNTHKNPWYRRQSVVAVFYYSAKRKYHPPFRDVIQLINNLLFDSHLYVQKGVGWTLRELYNVYPGKTYDYLLAHAHELAPASWQAATEKLSKQQKARLLHLRKSNPSYGTKRFKKH